MSGLTEEQRATVRYLLPGERIVVFARRHWTIVWEPVVTALASLILVIAVSLRAADSPAARGLDLLWWCWFAVVGRAAFKVWEWRRDHFVATDRRLLLIYGVIVRKVAMMPLKKVTDLSYHRSIWGRLFGFGTFVLESAGQDQALRILHHVDRPDETYQAIMSVIFGRPGDEQYGKAQVITVRPEDTTAPDSLARVQGLLPSKPRWADRFRRLVTGSGGPVEGPDHAWRQTAENPEGDRAQGDGIRVRPLVHDENGGPLSGGRSVYSSDSAPPPRTDEDDD